MAYSPDFPPTITDDSRYNAIRHVTWVGIGCNFILTIAQLLIGWIGHSQALIADGLHTLSDLLSDFVVLVAAKYSAQVADEKHPYGHARFETLATVIVGMMLILVGMGIFADGIRRLLTPQLLLQPSYLTLAIAFITIFSKEALYHYTVYTAKKVNSKMLHANAWHHRSDALSSVIVLVGIACSVFLNLPATDALAAIGVSLMIMHIGWSLGWGGIEELVDTGLEKTKIDQIKAIIKTVDGVRTLHELRTRQMGANALIDVHLLVNPTISVSEGHQIGEVVRQKLITNIAEIADVIVHIDSENDITRHPNTDLPLRHEIIATLQQHWQPIECRNAIQQITLHYLSNRVNVEIYLPFHVINDINEGQTLAQQFDELAAAEPYIRKVRVYFH
ncbi:cation diffusion facilitator family transporter [Beggiatoa leptomitoformis]|uniref:Cation diffusion facilitator family transporter n=1 Tax=Beggiatoa leptomitoformis TaxID=288004 RepID=A0A2N9YD23_9GAMM|nr:cation diffusion facilitator family transporter [Beggiatoa leptomitoformis]ALG69219.1 cation diffusion facilitator family transporter [Beggiatoa leptomitoformis]AUI68345.1 cation diffusion facilitator family transporter [Beggiatoa leptomitoformis]